MRSPQICFIPGLKENWKHKHECIRITYPSDQKSVERGIKEISEEIRRAFGRLNRKPRKNVHSLPRLKVE